MSWTFLMKIGIFLEILWIFLIDAIRTGDSHLLIDDATISHKRS